jgi:2-polyprenyl-6-hydroxyphenyl methylase/3-demethylubiquinone-9 3-methyltransferase
MELLEHVPDPYKFLKSLKPLLKPGGRLVCSTLNRSARSYLGAIVGAEYILKWLPIGTHQYKQFLKPSELASMGRQLDFNLENIQGVSLNPVTHKAKLSTNTDINYFIHWSLDNN